MCPKSCRPRRQVLLASAVLSSSLVLRLLTGVVDIAAAAPLPQSVEEGQAVFERVCVACHTIGGGRLVGPDLRGVDQRRNEEWIIAFVQHSQQVVASGDPEAVEVFEANDKIVMPDQALSADEIRSVIAFTREGSVPGPGQTTEVQPATEEQTRLGQNLFQGNVRLANGGPACNSCHGVTNDAVIGGGSLAKNLTTVTSRLGGPGVRAILGDPPFPVMRQAYLDRPITDEEVAALVGFFEMVDSEGAFHRPRGWALWLFGGGSAGALALIFLFSVAWGGRRRRSVHQSIYDRQVKST